MPRITGKRLNEKWRIGAKHVLYRATGDWYHVLEYFPGALCDLNGYLLFDTKEQYLNDPRLQIGAELTVPGGIAAHPRYVRAEDSN